MSILVRSLLLGMLLVSSCLVGCSSQPTIDPEADKPVMDNVPSTKP